MSAADAEKKKAEPLRTGEESRAYTADDYYRAALLLTRTYPAIKAERENIRKWQEGERKYTEDDALEELISITAKSDDSLGVRVQTSGTSDQTARIGTMLASGYVDKRQREITQELFTSEMLDHIAFLDWKISIVETAMAERMTKLQKAIYQLLFFKGYSYSQLIKGNKGKRALNKWKINHEKNGALREVTEEVEAAARYENRSGSGFMKELMEEVRMDVIKGT